MIKKDKRASALLFVAGLAGVSIALGLYLIFVQDVQTRARWSATSGALYFAQSGKPDLKAPASAALLDKAYEAHIKAVRLAPYEPSHWARLSRVLAAKAPLDPARARGALAIARRLEPGQRAGP